MIKTQLFIRDVELDISQDINFPITYAIADIKHPEKRKRNSSKTVVLPATQKNSRFFSSAYDLHLADLGNQTGFDFDPTLRYDARVKQNGIEIFRGSAHLSKVVMRNKQREFHIVLYSDIADLFQALGDLKVSELGWSDYDYTLSVANTVARFSPTLGQGVCIPLIDFGFTNVLTDYQTNQLFPYVFVKEIIEKCFEVAGFTVSSTWLNTTLIKSLIWGYGGGKLIDLSAAEIAARRANYSGDGIINDSIAGIYIGGFSDQMIFWQTIDHLIGDISPITTTLITDTYLQFDESLGVLTVFNKGNYNLNITGTFPTSWSYSGTHAQEHFEIVVRLEIFVNGAKVAGENELISTGTAGSQNIVFNLTHEMSLDAGDQIYCKIRVETIGSDANGYDASSTLDVQIDLNNTLTYDFTCLNLGLVDGDTVNVSRFVPDMKASDFMKDMITMFNLYMGDPSEEGVIILEPANDFYFGTDDFDDWTDKLGRGIETPIEIMPASNIEGKTYEFKWAEDLDYYKRLHLEEYGEMYGDYNYNVPSTFKKGSKEYKLKTAQSIPVQIEGTDIIIPRIVKLNDANLQTIPYKGKPRMFIWHGLTATADGWNLISTAGVPSAQTDWPLAHHLDDLTSPTFDLNFGVPQWVWYTATAYTSDNLFQRYWSRFIKEITGRDAKILTGMFNLRQGDLYDGFMQRTKNIDGVRYRVNVVKDYLANTFKMTKVELIKIIEGDSIPTYSIGVQAGESTKMGYGGDPSTPKTADFTATSNQNFYAVDTTSRDVTVTLPADDLVDGWIGSFKKTVSKNKLKLQPSGGGAGGSSIDGKTFVIASGKYDNIQVYFDGQNFYIL